MSLTGDAREAGATVLGAFRDGLAERVAGLLRSQPDLLETAVEVGLVEKDFLENPAGSPLRTATPLEVLKRFVERGAERRPSIVSSLGLNVMEVLSQGGDRAAAEGSPTVLAVVFTDLEGFTRYTARVGDEEAADLLAQHQRDVGPVVRSRGGKVVKRLGDGLMITFPEPEAAVRAAVELLDTAPAPLRLRAGVNWGEAVATRDDVIGHLINVAARVTENAKGGEVLVTEAVHDRVAGLPGVEFGKLRRQNYKGLSEPIRVSKVTASPPPATSPSPG